MQQVRDRAKDPDSEGGENNDDNAAPKNAAGGGSPVGL